MTDFVEGEGVVKLDNGETWTSRLAPVASSAALVEGDRVVVTRIDGAIAVVAPLGSVAAEPEPESEPNSPLPA